MSALYRSLGGEAPGLVLALIGGGLLLLVLLIWAIGRTPAGRATEEENRRADALGRRGQRQDWYGKHPDE